MYTCQVGVTCEIDIYVKTAGPADKTKPATVYLGVVFTVHNITGSLYSLL